MSDNMRIWEALGKTDPAHTKQFTRAGGFRGTAVKPMWANKQMTEFFGPCGIGWGMTEPIFQVVPAGGEIMVYCTVSLWYAQGREFHNTVYGVGGDKVVSQVALKDNKGQKIFDVENGVYKTYPQTDDEAFKKAYTDALSNAMKFIGVAADVHMGLFDDSKYVQAMKEEFESEVDAEVERQKAAAKEKKPIFDDPKEGDIAKKAMGVIAAVPNVTTANKLAPAYEGTWSVMGDRLTCIVTGFQEKMTKPVKGNSRPFIQLSWNGRYEGFNGAFVFHASLFDAIKLSVNKEVQLVLRQDGKFLNVEDVLSVDGVEYTEGHPANFDEQLKASTEIKRREIDDESIPF